jgi:hypothetical protein
VLRWGVHLGMVTLEGDRPVRGVGLPADVLADARLSRLAAAGVGVLVSSALLGLDLWDSYYCRCTSRNGDVRLPVARGGGTD